MGGRATRAEAAFTLIEMLAVVAIFALIAAIVTPNLGTLRSRALHQEAQRITSQLELARQRAVVTGIPHRFAMDLDRGTYWLEWLVTESEASGSEEPALPPPLDLRADAALPLAAPRAAERRYRPLPGRFGRGTGLETELAFASVETSEGWVNRGQAYVPFDRDGTTRYTTIVLDDEDGRTVVLDVRPLAEAVRLRREVL